VGDKPTKAHRLRQAPKCLAIILIFVLWEAVTHTKFCCSPEIKHFGPPNFWSGYATAKAPWWRRDWAQRKTYDATLKFSRVKSVLKYLFVDCFFRNGPRVIKNENLNFGNIPGTGCRLIFGEQLRFERRHPFSCWNRVLLRITSPWRKQFDVHANGDIFQPH